MLVWFFLWFHHRWRCIVCQCVHDVRLGAIITLNKVLSVFILHVQFIPLVSLLHRCQSSYFHETLKLSYFCFGWLYVQIYYKIDAFWAYEFFFNIENDLDHVFSFCIIFWIKDDKQRCQKLAGRSFTLWYFHLCSQQFGSDTTLRSVRMIMKQGLRFNFIPRNR